MNGVTVGGTSTLVVNGQTALDETITTKLTDYGLVGYTDKVEYGGDYSQSIGQYYDSELEAQGNDNAWGGSVDMYEAFTRLSTMRSKAGNGTTNTDITATYKNITRNGVASRTMTSNTTVPVRHYPKTTDSDYGSYIGNYVFTATGDNNAFSSSKIYMGGGTYETDEYFVTSTGYYITDGTHRLGYNINGTTVTLTDSTSNNPGNRFLWEFETLDGTGYIRCYDETATGTNRPRYVYLQYPSSFNNHQGTLSATLTPGTRTSWTIKKTGNSLEISTGNYRLAYINIDGFSSGWGLYEKDYKYVSSAAHSSVFKTSSGARYIHSGIVGTYVSNNSNTAAPTTEQLYFEDLTDDAQVTLWRASDTAATPTKYHLYAYYGNNNPRYRIVAATSASSGYQPLYYYGDSSSGYLRTRTANVNSNYVYLYCYISGSNSQTSQRNNPRPK